MALILVVSGRGGCLGPFWLQRLTLRAQLAVPVSLSPSAGPIEIPLTTIYSQVLAAAHQRHGMGHPEHLMSIGF